MKLRTAIALWLVTTILLAACGLLCAGLALAVAIGTILVAPSAAILVRLDRRRGLELAQIFLAAVSLRWAVSSLVNFAVYPSRPVLFAPDEFAYDYSGQLYALFLDGRIPNPWNGGGLAITGVIRMAGSCYWLFGHDIMIPKLVIGVEGGFTAVLAALIAARAFPTSVARRAGYLAAVFPSLVLWSSLLIKDTSSLLGVEIALLSFLHLRERMSLGALLGFALGLIAIAFERPYEIIFIALAVTASFTLRGERRFGRNLILFVALSAALLFVIRSTGAVTQALGENSNSVVDRLAVVRAGYSQVGVGSAVNTQLVDTSSPVGLLLWMPIGLIYFFLAPFPFTGTSIISLATSPEMILLYALLPSVWRSLKVELKQRKRPFMILFFYLLLSSIGWSTAITNVGTIYRYRAQVLFVVLILIAADQVRRRERARPAPVQATKAVLA